MFLPARFLCKSFAVRHKSPPAHPSLQREISYMIQSTRLCTATSRASARKVAGRRSSHPGPDKETLRNVSVMTMAIGRIVPRDTKGLDLPPDKRLDPKVVQREKPAAPSSRPVRSTRRNAPQRGAFLLFPLRMILSENQIPPRVEPACKLFGIMRAGCRRIAGSPHGCAACAGARPDRFLARCQARACLASPAHAAIPR